MDVSNSPDLSWWAVLMNGWPDSRPINITSVFRPPMGINRIIKLSYPFMPAVEPTSPHHLLAISSTPRHHFTVPHNPCTVPSFRCLLWVITQKELTVPCSWAAPASPGGTAMPFATFTTIQIVSSALYSSKTPNRACPLNCGFSLVNSIVLQKQNLWTYNFVNVSGHNLQSDCVNSKLQKKLLRILSQLRPRIRPQKRKMNHTLHRPGDPNIWNLWVVKECLKCFLAYKHMEQTLIPELKVLDGRKPAMLNLVCDQGGRAQHDFSLAWLEAAWYFNEGGHGTTGN
jgi:hypothetical protein